MAVDEVTVILATHRRPDALHAAIASVVSQTYPHWSLLVLADGCGEARRRVAEGFEDERIEYIDLPARFGEQAGPNSVGLDLATTSHVAFLNHDDVWLADHVEIALAGMRERRCDFWIARSGYACETAVGPQGCVRPVFSELRPQGRQPLDVVDGRLSAFEPCSAWVVRRDLAARIGPWQPAALLQRTPLADWFLRAIRQRARLAIGEYLTVLNLTTYVAPGRDGTYATASPEHATVVAWLRALEPGVIRSRVLAEIAAHGGLRPEPRGGNVWQRQVGGRVERILFRLLGVDVSTLTRRLRRRGASKTLNALSLRRTGAPLPEPPDLEDVIQKVRAMRARKMVAEGGLEPPTPGL